MSALFRFFSDVVRVAEPRTMSDSKKITVIFLGSDDSLKKALITILLGTDLSEVPKRNALKNTEIYENDTFELICTPNLNTQWKDVQEVYALNHHPDMSVLVVRNGFSVEEVWKQVEELSEKTGKPTDEFTVVLPLCHRGAGNYPFKSCTMGEVSLRLRQLAEGRHPKQAHRRLFQSVAQCCMGQKQAQQVMEGTGAS